MSQLGLGLGLTKGVVSRFNPLSLDPYLLFDTRSSMIGTLENPTLDLDPSKPDTLNVITATRSGTATYTDSNGVIQSASPDTVRVDYTQGEELTPTVYQRVGYTDFSSGWNNLNSTSEAGDGYLGQPSLIVNAPVLNARTTTSVPTETGVSYTASFYVRYVSGSSGLVWMYTQFASDNQFTPITVTSEWTRVQVQFTGGSGSAVNFGVSPKVAGESVEISQPQVEEGTTASSFVANTTGSPKFITGATYGPRVPMILVEPSATNLIGNSDFSSGWSLSSGATVEQTTEPTPLPSQTALRLTSTSAYSRYQTPSGYTSGTSTASVYIKWDGVDTRLRINRGLSNSDVLFNVTQGVVTHHSNTSDGYSIEEHGDGWWRVSNTMTNPTWVQLYADAEDGDGSILMALPQHEAGSVPTSYIPNPAVVSDNLNSVTSFEADGSTGGFNSIHTEGISGLSGKTVKVSFEVYDYEAGRGKAFAGISGSASSVIPTNSTNIEANGVYSGIVTADADQFLVRNQNGAENFKAKVRNISIVEMDESGVRAADDLVISGSDFTDFFSTTENTFYCEFDPRPSDETRFLLCSQATSARFIYQPPSNNSWYIYDGTSSSVFGTESSTGLQRAAATFDGTSKEASLNGGGENTSSHNGNLLNVPTELRIGKAYYGGGYLNGHIKRVIWWPYSSDRL